MSTPFKPSRIYIDEAVSSLPQTEKILKQFPTVPRQYLKDPKEIKKPKEMTWAKKGLFLARHKAGRPLKPFEANALSLGRPYYSFSPISNCHLECTYCILQSYLANNPMITIYTNIEEMMEKMERQLKSLPPESIISTGQIADSLALNAVTGYNQMLILFFGNRKTHLLELKTKSDAVDSLLPLPHAGQTVLSWSMNPPHIAKREEIKTASIAKRLAAAQKCARAGYKIGFHFDPMIYHKNWEQHYRRLTDDIFDTIEPKQIAWISLGTLRFPARQARVMKERFPKHQEIYEGLHPTHLPYLVYTREMRLEMIQKTATFIRRRDRSIKLYGCMEESLPDTRQTP